MFVHLKEMFTDAHCNYQWLSSACYVVSGIIYITTPTDFAFTILGAFAKLRKVNISVVRSVCLSVRMEQIGSHWIYLQAIYQYFQNLSKNSSLIKI